MSRLAEKRRAAGRKGAAVRRRRAEVKARIASGKRDLAHMLRDPAPPQRTGEAEEIRMGELLRSVPGIGPVTAKEILAEQGIPSDRPLSDMGKESRSRLADEIERSTP